MTTRCSASESDPVNVLPLTLKSSTPDLTPIGVLIVMFHLPCTTSVSARLRTGLRLPGTGAASRANDAGVGAQRIGNPGDVQDLGGRANGVGRVRGDGAIAAAAAAGLGDRRHDVLAIEPLSIERRQ